MPELNRTYFSAHPWGDEHIKRSVNKSIAAVKAYSRFAKLHGRRFLREQWRESRRTIPPTQFRPNPLEWSNDDLTVAWLGHATVLMNFYGTWILTDPVLRSRIGINFGGITLGLRRLVAPALSIKELPKLHAVLVSHSHMDHCDMGTLRRLPRQTAVVVQKNNGDLFRRFDKVHELSWGETVEIGGAKIEAIEVNHWGARTLTDRHRGYGGFLIQKNNRAAVFGGDTAMTHAFAKLKDRTKIDLAIMPIGAYNPYIYAHASPEQAWQMSREMGTEYILPMHHSTFRLSKEPTDEPIQRMFSAAGAQSWRIALSRPGQTWKLREAFAGNEILEPEAA